MGNLQFVHPDDFHVYSVAASSEDVSYPATNLKIPKRPGLVTRTTATGTPWWRADQGTADPVLALILVGANFPTVAIERSADAITWTAVTGSPFAVPLSTRMGARAAFLALTGVNHRYVRALPQGTPDGGGSVYELATMILGTKVNTFDRNASDFAFMPQRAETVIPFRGGGREVNVEGRVWTPFEFRKAHWRASTGNERALLEALYLIDGTRPVVFHRNNGDVSEVYVVGKTAQEQQVYSGDFPRHFAAGMRFEEWV